MHGGTVEVASEGLNRGSEFVVRLPVSWRGDRPGVLTDQPPLPASRATCRVLVVDDNIDAARALAILLRMAGNEIRIAHDGPTALEVAAAFQPELILLDIGMPGMDGYEVARRVRQIPHLEGVVLVALTGWGQDEDRRRTKAAGFDHHFVKPVDSARLEEIIQQIAERSSSADGDAAELF